MTDYTEFLRGLQLRHFKPREITDQARRIRGITENSLPPKSKWKNMAPTLWVADQVRHETGIIITITSAYRSPAYNKAVGGAPLSRHKENDALDLIPKNATSRKLFNALLKMRQGGSFKGGLGLYKSFVHLDTRGTNATWGNR